MTTRRAHTYELRASRLEAKHPSGWSVCFERGDTLPDWIDDEVIVDLVRTGWAHVYRRI